MVVLGDSVSEGYGVSREKSYPVLLEQKIQASGKKWQVVNSSISGSTTASAKSRLEWVLKNPPNLLILALGANDGLRGLPVAETKKNLSAAIQTLQQHKVQVVLAGMQMPPNYGKSFTTEFKNLFPSLAKQYKVTLIPFLLDKVAGEKELNQADGIHPNEKGQEILAQTVYESIKGLL